MNSASYTKPQISIPGLECMNFEIYFDEGFRMLNPKHFVEAAIQKAEFAKTKFGSTIHMSPVGNPLRSGSNPAEIRSTFFSPCVYPIFSRVSCLPLSVSLNLLQDGDKRALRGGGAWELGVARELERRLRCHEMIR